jgi:hypothetical protein
MRKITTSLVTILLILNISTFFIENSSADPIDHYPFQPDDEIIQNALNFLGNKQEQDGSIGGYSVTSWAAMAIAAAEQDLHNWGNLIQYIREHAYLIDNDKAQDWERQALAIVACDENPRDFGGINYVDKIKEYYDGTQIVSNSVLYDDMFGILALVSSGVNKSSAIIQNLKNYILNQKAGNGGWGDVDATSTAIMALVTAGVDKNSEIIKDALEFLKKYQDETGGFKSWGGTNAASTSWAVCAITAAGQNPSNPEWENNSKTPIDYLISLQQDDGSFNWTIDKKQGPEWMTSYAVIALLGKYYPVKTMETVEEPDDDDEEPEKDEPVYEKRTWTGNIRIEGKTETIYSGKISFSGAVINAINISTGQTERHIFHYPNILGALDKASETGGFTYTVEYYPDYDSFLVTSIESDYNWWQYWVDYKKPMKGCDKFELNNDYDKILWGYCEEWETHALQITTDKNNVNKEEKLVITVTDENMNPVENTDVFINENNNQTDKNGELNINLTEEGEYIVYAEKTGYIRSDKICINVMKNTRIIKPMEESIYLWDKRYISNIFKPKTTYIFGRINIKVQTVENIEKIEFYINNQLKHVDNEPPYEYSLNKKSFFKKTTITVIPYIKTNVTVKLDEIIPLIMQTFECTQLKIITYMLNKSMEKRFKTTAIIQGKSDETEVIITNIFPALN